MSRIDMTGQKFGRLTVIKTSYLDHNSKLYWLCKCECGSERIVWGYHLRTGNVKSCGCYRRDGVGKMIHGMRYTHEWYAWRNAKTRCFNKNCNNYSDYGGRGITMCEEWKNDFTKFYEYIGDCPDGYVLDRINNDGNYEPGNVRWIDENTSNKNRRY